MAALEEVVALVGGGSDRPVPGTGAAPATPPQVVADFLAAYYRRAPIDDLVATPATTLVGAALSHWELAQGRPPGEPRVAVRTPREAADGWETGHSVVEVVDDDLPFLVDSVRMALSRKGLGMHLMVHPVLRVRRDGAGRIVDVGEYEGPEGGDPGDGSVVESFIHVEVDRQSDPGVLADVEAELRRVERDVRAAAEDWPAMLDALEQTVVDLESGRCPEDRAEVDEAAGFLRWAAAGHLTFLGCRDYDLSWRGDDPELHPVPGTGLGILGDLDGGPEEGWRLPDKSADDPGVVVLTKAAARSTVHRPAHLDQVSVTRYDRAGQVVGERRFLGLYTPVVYETHPAEIPVVRRKVTAVVDRAGFPPGSHSGRELRSVLETYPRDELFEIATDELFDIAMGICDLQERQQVRLFTRRDRYGRFVSCLVFVPREPLDTETERTLVQVLVEAFGGRGAESQIRLSESVLARLHVLISLGAEDGGQPPPARVDLGAVEASLARVVRSWARDLTDALVGELGEDEGLALARRYEGAFPRGYQVDFDARSGVADLRRLEALDPAGDLDINLYRPLQAAPGTARVKLYRAGGPLPVSRLLPLLEHLGVEVVDERPYEIRPGGSPSRWVYDFGVRAERVSQLAGDEARDRFHRAFLAVWDGRAEDDGLNRLVVRAGIAWRDVAVLRAYARYLRQTGSALSNEYLQEALIAHPEVASLLVRAFHVRFAPMAPAGPEGKGGSVEERRAGAWARLAEETAAAIDQVASLDQDRILRSFLGLVEATVRTTAFRPGTDGAPRASLALKLDPSRVPGLPRPRPAVEVFVYSPRTEGVHLRGGRVARGGIRWSDRREDFRTEILSLMKAQMVKNAVIVPVGAKGGFVVKRPPEDPAALHQEVVACYQTLVAGMLDLSDNLVGGGVTHPPEVVRYDGDDPYLVVAADKGTATFSDVANAIAVERGYWLGDAFAAGGSTGYDHKALGITARGAWEAVRRHFAALGQDADAEELTVVGIGDMSGDVFGNGLLRSRHLKLVAAFDHRHIFVDPDPDPGASYQERARLFDLPRSSWADYDPAALSPGGGVFSRAAKSVTLSLEAQAALGVDADVLTPDEVIRAILQAPVDLLWNGGIGTYVKAGAETDGEVGDRTNDAVRVDASDLRCRVVGEGGNLGLTQAARVELALAGGKVNTDAIDNAGGVDCSDHEVNIKVLLDGAVAAGALPGGERDRLLADTAEEVAELVLAHNRRQTQALADTAAEAPSLVDVHRRYVRALEQEGKLDRDLEHLPTDEALDDRAAA
ncbi:MAG TPA: NAD-glutamate dehydrogenase, partial [Acidimicrobiales bacterium]|nr:NAD-glutamate dehydrogenase [Acidimicrobiales bacterium]